MNRLSFRTAWLAAIALTVWSIGIAAQQNRAEQALRAARETETLKGCKEAIAPYEKIAQGGDRAVAAKALILEADCYEKLGKTESQKLYERVIRDYADQKDAVTTARARLGGQGGTDVGTVTRQVWTGPDVDSYGGISPDGRFLSFTDWTTGDLAIRDLARGGNRRLTGKKDWSDPAYAMGSAISRDGTQVAYGWGAGSSTMPVKDHFSEVRLIDLNGGKPRTLLTSHDFEWAYVHDWSPDGQWLAVGLNRVDGTRQIGLVSTDKGIVRVLKSGATSKMAFSPDGKYLAYDLVTTDDRRDVHVMTVDGSVDTAAVTDPANDAVLGWSPDGKHLLFASDRFGSSAVWGLPMNLGKPSGEPKLIKPNINPMSLGITRSGVLYYSVVASEASVYVASADFESGTVLSPPTMVPHEYFGSNNFPAWSPDGKYLAYLSQRDSNTRGTRLTGLWIRSMENGSVRELRANLSSIYATGNTSPLWLPDGKSLVVTGADKQGRDGIYRVDAQTGETTQLIRDQTDESAVALSPDGGTLYLRATDANTQETFVMAREMPSGREREVVRTKLTVGRGLSLSPDGRSLAFCQLDPRDNSTSVRVVSAEGGESRELAHASDPERIIGALSAWTPDGKSVLFSKDSRNGASRQLWRVDVAGGADRRVNLNAEWSSYLGIPGAGPASFHPDGHQVAFVMGEHKIEIWTIENFLRILQ